MFRVAGGVAAVGMFSLAAYLARQRMLNVNLKHAEYYTLPLHTDIRTSDHGRLASSKPASGTLVFTINPLSSEVLFLVGMQSKRKASNQSVKSWDAGGGKLKAGETPEQAAARELIEELGLKPEYGMLLPKVTYKVYTDTDNQGNQLVKSKATTYLYIDYQAFTKYLDQFLKRSRTNIENSGENLELSRFGLVKMDDFFRQLQGEGDTPTATLDRMMPTLFEEDGIDADDRRPDQWRKAAKLIYGDVALQSILRAVILEFQQQLNNSKGVLPMPLPIPEVPVSIKMSDFKPFDKEDKSAPSGSSDFMHAEIDGVHYIAKSVKSKVSPVAPHTARAEYITGKFNMLMGGVDVVPGRIVGDEVTGRVFFVMPDMIKNFPEANFKTGIFDDEIDKTFPGLYADAAVVAATQRTFFPNLLVNQYDAILKNDFVATNADGSHIIVKSDNGASLGSKAGGKIAGFPLGITPLGIYVFMTQAVTQTPTNEPYNRLIDYKTLQRLKTINTDAEAYEILKSAIKDPEALRELLVEFEAKFTDTAIEAIIAEAFAQLPDRRPFAEELAWRESILKKDIQETDAEYNEGKLFIDANKDTTDPEAVKALKKAKAKVERYFTSRALLSFAEQNFTDLKVVMAKNPNYSEQDFLRDSMLSRKNSVLELFNGLLNELRPRRASTPTHRML
jgi:hypothetical protein